MPGAVPAAPEASEATPEASEATVEMSVLVTGDVNDFNSTRLQHIRAALLALVNGDALVAAGLPRLELSDVSVSISAGATRLTLSGDLPPHRTPLGAAQLAGYYLSAPSRRLSTDLIRFRMAYHVGALSAPMVLRDVAARLGTSADASALVGAAAVSAPGPSLVVGASAPPAPSAAGPLGWIGSWVSNLAAYIGVHPGFVLAFWLIILLPLKLGVACCTVRLCRRRCARKEASREAMPARGNAEEPASEPAYRARPSRFAPSLTASPDAEAQPHRRAPSPEPVVDPLWVPVDAYHGVAPKGFHI